MRGEGGASDEAKPGDRPANVLSVHASGVEHGNEKSESSPSAAPGRSPGGALQPVLTCTSVSASYGRHPVLHDVSLTLHAGTMTAIIGPNGSGKSSLLRVLAGALPYGGAVELDRKSYR